MKDWKETLKSELNEVLADLINFIEFEEAMTVDPKTQIRIRKKLEELGIWEKID